MHPVNSAIQIAVLALIVAVIGSLVLTTHQNLQNQGITSGFGFLERTTGWDIPFSTSFFAACESDETTDVNTATEEPTTTEGINTEEETTTTEISD